MSIDSYVISSMMAISKAKIAESVSISVMKKAMDVEEAKGMAIAEMINSIPNASHLLDVYA